MKKKKFIFFICMSCIMAIISSCHTMRSDVEKSPVDYVNPYAGNISHLLVPTFPTVHLPNSMLRIYPERADYTSDLINGLPIAVTSHRGSSAFNLSPAQADSDLSAVINYSYDLEKITPYSYSVYLDQTNIAIEYAPSHQAGIYSVNFEKKGDNKLIIHTRNGELKADANAVSGYQIIDNTSTKIYLYAETRQKPMKAGILVDGKIAEGKAGSTIVLNFGDQSTINFRYGISFISAEQAQKNLNRDIKTYSVATIADEGRKLWNETLSKINVTGGSDDERSVFYTSLYRTYERMINISEDGRYYSAFDNKVHNDNGTPFYTDDWIWDTYRATHPLRVLIEPKMEIDMIKSYIRMAQQSPEGWMPTFPEVVGDTHRMNGNHAVAVIWDAYCKRLTNFDLEAAYEACKRAMTEKTLLPWLKQPLTELDVFYDQKGFYPALHPGEKETHKEVHPFERRQSISVMLGNSYDNWCLAQIAKALNKNNDYDTFLKKSYSYRNVYNKQTGFFHPKDKNGNFIEPLDYKFSGGQGARDYYGENNAWIYRWDIQHNPADLIALMGGNRNFINNLDQTFRESLGRSKFEFYAQLPDHTGNVGQYSMANEPCLHIPYLYNYAGEPWMTQKRIRELLDQWFRNDLMGMPGDEDGGGMTAFVVFSMMGFYPVTPGSATYNIGSPVFETAKLDLNNGKYFEVVAQNYSPDNKYIQSATLNGKEWVKPWFGQEDIKDGGKLVLIMGNKANKNWGTSPNDTPPSSEKIKD